MFQLSSKLLNSGPKFPVYLGLNSRPTVKRFLSKNTAPNFLYENHKVIAPNWMQNFWANFLSIFCTGIVFIMSIVMHFRPKNWTKEKMISVSLGVTCLLFLATASIGNGLKTFGPTMTKLDHSSYSS